MLLVKPAALLETFSDTPGLFNIIIDHSKPVFISDVNFDDNFLIIGCRTSAQASLCISLLGLESQLFLDRGPTGLHRHPASKLSVMNQKVFSLVSHVGCHQFVLGSFIPVELRVCLGREKETLQKERCQTCGLLSQQNNP